MKHLSLTFLLLAVTFGGQARAQSLQPTAAQATLQTETLVITSSDGHKHQFTVEVAKTLEQQETGLMFRTSVPPKTGMLFPMPAPVTFSFWMKDTVIPLDMIFINQNGTIRTIMRHDLPQSLAPISSGGPVLAGLELGDGIADADNIKVGDKVTAIQFKPN